MSYPNATSSEAREIEAIRTGDPNFERLWRKALECGMPDCENEAIQCNKCADCLKEFGCPVCDKSGFAATLAEGVRNWPGTPVSPEDVDTYEALIAQREAYRQ